MGEREREKETYKEIEIHKLPQEVFCKLRYKK
jgi:hypothetical protein